MMLIAGTIPDEDLPLVTGEVAIEDGLLIVDRHRINCTQGTAAMVSAALATTSYLKINSPHVVLAGDIGEGKGSREIYEYLIQNIAELSPDVLALHYWLPDMALTRKLCQTIEKCDKKPIMIADAGSMYSAKAAGLAKSFDIFTPDATEIAFLADPDAMHPAYVARHLFDTDITQAPGLATAAYQTENASKILLVKGSIDYVIKGGNIIETIDEPDVPVLEAIGGTGDTITGLVSAFVYAGLDLDKAAIIAARSNRMAGKYAQPTPATRVKEIITHFPDVFLNYLCQWSEVCCIKGEY